MPEGPEVKRCAEVLSGVISGKEIASLELISGKFQRLGIKGLDEIPLPVKVTKVSSRGKQILIELNGDHNIISTLGMSGWWYPDLDTLDRKGLDVGYAKLIINTIFKAEKHTRLRITTSDGSVANFIDPRNFGNFYVLTDEEFKKKQLEIGTDVLNDNLLAEEEIIDNVHRVFQSKRYAKKPLGEVLLDQSIISGIGNIYRAEVMYLAKMSPHRAVYYISREDVRRILRCVELVLIVAYLGRGSMYYPAQEVVDLLGKEPPFEVFRARAVQREPWDPSKIYLSGHLVYGMNKDIFLNSVTSEQVGGRTCWWVPEVQT